MSNYATSTSVRSSQHDAKIVTLSQSNRTQKQDLPYSREAEQAVIGAVLIDPTAFYNVADYLVADDFFDLAHVFIWHAFERITEDPDLEIDTLTVADYLENHHQLEQAGGRAYLITLVNNTPTSVHAEVYGRIVLYASKRRQMIEAANTINKLARDESITFDKAVLDAQAAFDEASRLDHEMKATQIGQIADEYRDYVLKMMKSGDRPGWPSGLASLDNRMKGFKRGEVVYLLGRNGDGKSTFMSNMAHYTARVGGAAAIFSAELTKVEYLQRILAHESGLTIEQQRDMQFSEQQLARFIESLKRMNDWPLHIEDDFRRNPTPTFLERKIRQMNSQRPLDIVFVDGLWLMRDDEANPHYRKGADEYAQMRSVSMRLRDMARDLNIRLVVANQYNREFAKRPDKRPRLGDSWGGTNVGNNASVVMALYRGEHPDVREQDAPKGLTELHVIKNGNGPSGYKVDVRLDQSNMRFVDYDWGGAV